MLSAVWLATYKFRILAPWTHHLPDADLSSHSYHKVTDVKTVMASIYYHFKIKLKGGTESQFCLLGLVRTMGPSIEILICHRLLSCSILSALQGL